MIKTTTAKIKRFEELKTYKKKKTITRSNRFLIKCNIFDFMSLN